MEYKILTTNKREILKRQYFQIMATETFVNSATGITIEKGTLGGWIEHTGLSSGNIISKKQEDTCWIDKDVILSRNSRLLGNAYITGKTTINGCSIISGNTIISGDFDILSGELSCNGEKDVTNLSGKGEIINTEITGKPSITGNVFIKDSTIKDRVKINGKFHIEWSEFSEAATLIQETSICEDKIIIRESSFGGDVYLLGWASIEKCLIRGHVTIVGHMCLKSIKMKDSAEVLGDCIIENKNPKRERAVTLSDSVKIKGNVVIVNEKDSSGANFGGHTVIDGLVQVLVSTTGYGLYISDNEYRGNKTITIEKQ